MTRILKKGFAAIALSVLIVSVYFIAGLLILSGAQYSEINTRNLVETVKFLEAMTPSSVFTDSGAASAWASQFRNYQAENFSNVPYRITLIRRDGRVIFDTDADSGSMEDHLDRPEFQTAIRGGIGSERRRSATMGQEYIYAAIGLKNQNGETAGVLRLSRLVPSFSSRLLNSAFPFLFGAFLLILAASISLYRYSRSLSKSIEEKLDAQLEKKSLELTERTKETEAEGHRREVILNSMSEGVMAVDSNQNVILVNPRLCALFNINENAVHGMSLLSFSRSPELEEAARQVLSSGQTVELTLKRYTSGIEQHFQVIAAPLKANPPVEIHGVVIVMSDISRLVKLEQVRKDFAANVSHELRTPIQVIKGFAENILGSSLDNKEEIRYFAEIIAKNTETMGNLTNDLMTLVSLEDESNPRPVMDESALAPLINEAKGMVETAAEKKNISIEIFCPPDLSAKLYGSLIVQALINLLDNGIKYSDPGSRIRVYAFQEEKQLVIEVKDKGIGIPAEHMNRLFERFYRVDKARSRDEGGTGLGLAIVRHIALLHKGSVEAESHAGEGSAFRLRLPC